MKKYVKPEIYFESFQLSQHIAACGWDLNSLSVETCTSMGDNQGVYGENNQYVFIEGPAFVGSNERCGFKVDLIGMEQYCYTNASSNDANNVFNSQ